MRVFAGKKKRDGWGENKTIVLLLNTSHVEMD